MGAGNDRARILVVEDERIIARDLAMTLGDLGYDVVGQVAKGEDAVAQAKELRPDLVLMDIRLAGEMDGISAATRIREDRDVPVIYLSSHSDRDTLRRATLTAPLAYLVKPFKAAELKCAIEIALYRHEIDARLRERERWLKTTLRSITEGVVGTDPSDKVLFLNPVAEALTGWQHDEAIGKALSDILRIVYGHEGSSTVVDRRGGATPITDNANAVFDEKGKFIGGVTVLRDIREQRRAEDDIRRLNEELEAKVAARTQKLEAANKELEAFSYSVAHDLRAPLRGIEGFSQVLIEEHVSSLGPEGVDHLNRIRESTKRMTELIDDLLDLARLTRLEMVLAPVDLSAIARSIEAELRAADRRRTVHVHIQEGLVAECDARLVRIALDNLLRNAWKFSSKRDVATIRFGRRQSEGESFYFVSDDGAGFDMQYADLLFAAFERLHSPGEFEGAGIGLTIVQRVILRHGGRVWAEGAVGRGATFFFTLPGIVPG